MTIFDPKECATEPRADMFLPNWVRFLGLLLEAGAVAFAVAAFVTQTWTLLIGFLLLGVLGIAAHLCWKNQTIQILDQSSFEYSTFLGKKTRYYFSDVKKLRQNPDSWTLFVGDGKIHIESLAYISKDLLDKLNVALARAKKSSGEE